MKRVKQKITNVFNFSRSSSETLTLGLRIVIGFIVTILTIGMFLRIGENVLNKEAVNFDSTVTQLVYSLRGPTLTKMMNDVSFLGGEAFLGFAIILTIIFLFKKYKRDAFIFTFILLFGLGLNFSLKYFFQRPRPNLFPLVLETSYSFPSGHAMNSFIFYTCLSFFIFRKMQSRKIKIALIGISTLLIILIGISRIYLGVHYPSDVLAGYTAGLFWFVLVLLFERTLIFFRLFKEYEKNKISI